MLSKNRRNVVGAVVRRQVNPKLTLGVSSHGARVDYELESKFFRIRSVKFLNLAQVAASVVFSIA